MKLFVIYAEEWQYDECDSITVLAKTKERAIEIAEERHIIFIDNIGLIKEIDLDKETFVHESINWG